MKHQPHERPFDAVIGWTGIALFIFTCLSGIFPSAVNWGVHFWGFLPLPVVLALAAFFVLSLVPAFQTAIVHRLDKTLLSFRGGSAFNRWGVWLVVSVSAGVLFWFLREATHFLGDGYLLLRTLPLAVQSGDIPASFPAAPLTGVLAISAFRLFTVLGAADPALLAWQCISIGSGIVALPLTWSLAGLLWTDRRERLLGFLLLLFSGSAMLYFGHVEIYPPAFAGLVAYIGSVLGVQLGKRTLRSASVIFVVLCLLHVGMVVLVPSLLFLYVRHFRVQGWRSLVVPCLVSAGVLALGLLLLDYAPGSLFVTVLRDGGSFLPFSAPDPWGDAFSLFSLWHVVDLINIFLLVSPLSLVLVGGFLASALLPARFRHADAIFWMMLAGPALVWLFLNNFELGLSRDWDLASPFVFVVALAGVVSWNILTGPSKARLRGLVVMSLLTMVQTAAWVGVNASTPGSLLRFDSLLDFRFQSQRAVAIALEEVGGYRSSRNDLEGAADAYAQCVVLDSTNARRWMLLANAAGAAGNTVAATAAYGRAIQLKTDDPEAYLNVGILLYNEGKVEEGIRRVQEAAVRDSTSIPAMFTLGRMYQDGAGDSRTALRWYTRVLHLDSTHAEARARAAACDRAEETPVRGTRPPGK